MMVGFPSILVMALVAGLVIGLAINYFLGLEISSLISSPENDKDYRYIVPPEKIVSGGVPKDGIPSIDSPKFVTVKEARKYLSDGELVAGIKIGDDARAYPLMILVWHEIVNDVVGGKPVAITFCPLCYSVIAFERILDGEPVEFGVSGLLYNSNLVMYDRKTESLWSQMLGMAIAGHKAGERLKFIPIDVMKFSDWVRLNPNTKVLSTDTGYPRPYGRDPYGNYYRSPLIWFPVENKDDRLFPKEIVYGIDMVTERKAYWMDALVKAGVINDVVAGKPIVIFALGDWKVRFFYRTLSNAIGSALEFEFKEGKIFDKQTGSEWNFDGVAIEGPLKGMRLERVPQAYASFWFAWVAYYPDTGLYVGEIP